MIGRVGETVRKNTNTFLCLLSAVLLLACIATAFFLIRSTKTGKEYEARLSLLNEEKEKAESALNEADARIAELEDDVASLTGKRDELTSALAEKSAELQTLETRISQLTASSNASGEYQKTLLQQLSALEKDVASYKAQIDELDRLIDSYENITSVNFGVQAEKVSALLLKVNSEDRPKAVIRTETKEKDKETGEPIYEEHEEPCTVSFFYQDLDTGYTLACNEGKYMYTASVVKAPYVYSILKTVADFEYKKRNFDAAGNPLYDEEGNALFKGKHPNLDEKGNIVYAKGEEKYDLNRVWTYDEKTMMEDGSGEIRKQKSGFTLTYKELISYTIRYSDNIAFSSLRSLFGTADYFALCKSLGVKGYARGFMQLSSADCALFLKDMYAFMEENETWGAFLKNEMLNTKFTALLANAVYPTPVAHKYGWDEGSYHDIGIVYHEHPYVIVIMSNLDEGGDEANTYLRSIIRLIRDIHKNFYSAS